MKHAGNMFTQSGNWDAYDSGTGILTIQMSPCTLGLMVVLALVLGLVSSICDEASLPFFQAIHFQTENEQETKKTQ